MASFTPPADIVVPAYTEDSTPLQKRLMRHSNGGVRGRNVWIMTDGTVTETAPDGYTYTDADVAHVFLGGHVAETVTAAERTLLEAAGYTVND